jgi:GNAT superfamily N-acetyltransferase
MSISPALAELFGFLDGLHEVVEQTWWGVVATDSRFPQLWEANYAAVDSATSDLTLEEVQEALLPALRRAGTDEEHIWVMHPEASSRLLDDLEARGRPLHWDTLMRRGPDRRPAEPEHRVEEVGEPGAEFWEVERLALREFGITEPRVVEQALRRHREVSAPAGKRWFVGRVEGGLAGIGSMLVHGDAAFVDDVVTFPPFRRRGVARSVVRAMLREAGSAGAGETYLFADQPGPIRLYEGLGFEVVRRVATSLATAPEGEGQLRAGRSAGNGPGRPR